MSNKQSKSCSENRSITAVGIIVPVAWDNEGNPIQVALSGNDEHEYVIDTRSKKGREAAGLLKEHVQIEGILTDNGSIIVKRYKWMD